MFLHKILPIRRVSDAKCLNACTVHAALRIYTSVTYQRSTTVSSVATNQFDFYYFSRDSSMLPDCSYLFISVYPSISGGNPDLFLSDRPFTSTGGCDWSATLCINGGYNSGGESVYITSAQATSTGYFYVAVKGVSATAYTLSLEWWGGVCSFSMFQSILCAHLLSIIVLLRLDFE